MMGGKTGGGLITNSRTKSDNSIPKAGPMRPPAQKTAPAPQPAQQAAPQQPMPEQAPPQQMPPQGVEQGMPPQGMEQGMPPEQGMMDPGMDQGMGDDEPGMNKLANNALMLLHDPEASKEYESMFQRGEKGVATAIVNIMDQVISANEERGIAVEDQDASEALSEVMDDVFDLSLAQGYLSEEPLIDGIPASLQATITYALDMGVERFPDMAQSMRELYDRQESPETNESGKALAEYMKQIEANPRQMPPEQQAPQEAQAPQEPQQQQAPQGLIR